METMLNFKSNRRHTSFLEKCNSTSTDQVIVNVFLSPLILYIFQYRETFFTISKNWFRKQRFCVHLSSSYKPVWFIKSVKIRLDICWLLQVSKTKLVDKKSWQSTCIKPVENLQQDGTSDANASWYRLDDCHEATILQQTCPSCAVQVK